MAPRGAYLQSRASTAQQVREYFAVLNGVAVKLNGTLLAVLRNGPGVQTVQAATVYRHVVRPGQRELWSGAAQ